ncbi:hypothetical protein CDD80_548 [Ophiocordyceps camponoti-rufipedis]|uniref:Uncharacterized protein n=1 Tax=Ophiocordyceps camponoti-rufipedis TaxID=2004952 RepID=A0A2C5ZDI0_9HYPO|nr:hypothetical protein CDD80_548 [Ophiocordyceps camponoti-rufipedis]
MTPRHRDLPQIWQRPSLDTLLDTLHEMELRPSAWDGRRRRRRRSSTHGRSGEKETRYLATIIKSPLAWMSSDEQRERVWELASKRMSERCGRTAMGEMVRTFSVGQGVELVIREPAMTGDDALGLKTWASALVLARQMPALAATSVAHLLDGTKPRVLELGAGTGLVGLAAAALWGVVVAVSDLPRIVDNLRYNVEANEGVVGGRGGRVVAGALTWGADEAGCDDDEVERSLFGEPFQFDVVLAADPLYDDDHPRLLASTIGRHLAKGKDSRAMVMVPRRDATTVRLLEAFRDAMAGLEARLVCDEEEELLGRDDWGGGEGEDGDCDGDGDAVRCWLGVFSRGE